ncbi:hypothetical protein [Haloquadratum walsbyi]|uniref:hypothetical protein n=1 Tax=Haloquadratum walsbyi TaxID=293091 RepID=UPI00373FD7D5
MKRIVESVDVSNSSVRRIVNRLLNLGVAQGRGVIIQGGLLEFLGDGTLVVGLTSSDG